MSAIPQQPTGFPRRGTLAEYDQLEEGAGDGEKYEYADGMILAMAGADEPHALIAMNVGAALVPRLRGGPCRVYSESLRIGVPRRTYTMHGDVTVVCGPSVFDAPDARQRTVLNPRLVVEVLTTSTELYDRGEKFERYMQIESLAEYVLVTQHRPAVQSFFRQSDGTWSFTHAAGTDAVLRLRSIDVDLPLAEAFAGVVFPPAPTDDGENPDR